MRDGYGFNEGEMCFILSRLWVNQSILHSWGDISVLLLLWQSSWEFSSVPSGKLRFLTCLIGNTELLRMECRVIAPHLAERGKSHEFSRVTAGTWCIFSSYSRDGHLKLRFVPRNQDSCEDMQTPQEVKLCLAGKYGRFCRWGARPSFPY